MRRSKGRGRTSNGSTKPSQAFSGSKSENPPQRDTPAPATPAPAAAKRVNPHRQPFERQKLVEEIIAAAAPAPKENKYAFKDVTTDLAVVPEKLEIYPTKTAPSLYEIENRYARQREHEKLKFFNIPIKMYDADENGTTNLLKVDFKEEDKVELDRYGSRVVMSHDGHVAAVEVQQDVMNQFKRKRLNAEICQCVEKEYEVSERLKNNPRARRLFMAKVLTLECLLRLPSLLILYCQKEYAQLHDFIYQQVLLIFFMNAIVQGTRLAGIYFSEVGRYEPCRSIITVLTMTGYCMMSALMTALMQQYSILYVEYQLYEDPVSLETLQAKRKLASGQKVSYPYVIVLLIIYLMAVNLVLSFILVACNKRVMDELGNGFLLVIFFVSTGMACLSFYVIVTLKFSFFSTTPIGWDRTQILFTYLVGTKWPMWRFYMLQLVVRGKTLKVDEDISQFVALNFAI